MNYQWDPVTAAANRTKHGVAFPDATAALEDPLALTIPDDHAGELRFATVGTDLLGHLVVVIWTSRATIFG